MIEFIEVTSSKHGGKIFINPQMLGHISTYVQTGKYVGEVEGRRVTTLGVTTHNNGGFNVLETPEEIIEKIKDWNHIQILAKI